MRKTLFLLLLSLLPLAADAQVTFGYLSYDEALKSMPDYAIAVERLASLRDQYAAETKRAEDDFNDKYESFLSTQATLATPILRKRQAELQDLVEKNVAFNREADRLLSQAEADLQGPLRAKLDDVLRRIGEEKGYAFILNTDNNALPFINPACGEDISAVVKEALAAEQE